MNWLSENWLTALPLFGAALAWIWSTWYNALTYRQEHRAKQWLRYEQLVRTLNNINEDGYWVQLTALEEMKNFQDKKFTLKILKEARKFWANQAKENNNPNPKIISDLDSAISEMGG